MFFSRALSAKAVLVASFAILAIAQTITDLPDCAQTPVIDGIVGTGCDLTDIACLCSSTKLIDGLRTAIAEGCSPADQETALAFAQALCQSSVGEPPAPAPEAPEPAPASIPPSEPEPLEYEAPPPIAVVPVVSSDVPSSPAAAVTTAYVGEETPSESTSTGSYAMPTQTPLAFEGAAPSFGGVTLLMTGLAMVAMGFVFAEL